jgi:hypothetical protein
VVDCQALRGVRTFGSRRPFADRQLNQRIFFGWPADRIEMSGRIWKHYTIPTPCAGAQYVDISMWIKAWVFYAADNANPALAMSGN